VVLLGPHDVADPRIPRCNARLGPGLPDLAIMRSLNAFCKVSAVAVRSGTSSAHFENRSIRTKNIWLPYLDLSSGPTKTAHTVALLLALPSLVTAFFPQLASG